MSEKDGRRLQQPKPLPKPPVNWFGLLILVLSTAIVVSAGWMGLDYSGRSSTCAGCHEMRPYYKSWKTLVHKEVACVKCHQAPGIFGALSQRAGTLQEYSLISVYLRRFRPPLAEVIDINACLTCHRDKIIKTTFNPTTGLRMRHKEVIESAMECTVCHRQTGHASKTAGASRPMHEYCFACHDQLKSGQNCSACHSFDVGYRGLKQTEDFRKIELPLDKCDGCHPINSCSACHQGKLPQLLSY